MLKIFTQGLATILLTTAFASNSESSAHVHDEGTILVIQQENMWNIQFEIPAINAFGFEHEPETTAERNAVKQFVKTISKLHNVVHLAPSCEVQSQEESISDLLQDKHHDHDNHHDHDEHEDTHSNAVFNYLLECKKPLQQIDIVLFEHLKHMHSFNVQWVTDKGQGATTITDHNTKLSIR